jgi:uncharacterized phiE125 gp8 family phage protein
VPALTLITPPAEEPCSLVELRSWCREPAAQDNGVLHDLMRQARELIERPYGLQLVEATWRLDLHDLARWDGELGLTPATSVESVTYLDPAGVRRTVDPATYALTAGLQRARVYLTYDPTRRNFWPMALYQEQAASVTFRAGWPNARLVPPALRGAVCCAVADWYENRERLGALPEGAKSAVRAFWDGAL